MAPLVFTLRLTSSRSRTSARLLNAHTSSYTSLFVVVIHRGAFAINEVLRISGPLDELIRARRASAR